MTLTPSLEALHEAFMKLVPPAPAPAAGIPAVAVPPPPPAPATSPAPSAATPPPASPASAAGTVAAPGTAAVVAPPPVPPSPCRLVDPRAKGWHLDVTVAPENVVEAARLADRQGFAIDAVTGVDWLAAGEMEVVYDYFHPSSPLHLVVRTRVPRAKPEVPTISEVFPGANWHERETHDFFGIRFLGHPDLSPLLLPEDADYHPLRKDFAGAA